MTAKILVVEDEGLVALDLKDRLERFGYEVSGLVATAEEALARAEEASPDLVLLDIRIEGPVDGVAAARALRAQRDVPVIFLTAHSDDATIQRAKVTEPHGYVLKPIRDRELQIAIEMALYKSATETAFKRLVAELQDALAQVRKLSGLLPMCASCKKIRDDRGYWQAVEVYIEDHSEAAFSHGFCPDCLAKLYPGYYRNPDSPPTEEGVA